MKRIKIIFIFAILLTMLISCQSLSVVERKESEKRTNAYSLEYPDFTLPQLNKIYDKGEIIAEATVKQIEKIEYYDGEDSSINRQTITLQSEDGSILITESDINNIAVNGKLNLGNVISTMGDKLCKNNNDFYANIFDYNNPKNVAKRPVKKSNDIYAKYKYLGVNLCRELAEYKLIEKMNEVGGQMIFMPNYIYSYEYNDKRSEGKHELVEEYVTTIHLKITASAINFLR